MSLFKKKTVIEPVRILEKPVVVEAPLYLDKDAAGAFRKSVKLEPTPYVRPSFQNLENMHRVEALCNAGVNLYQRCVEETDFILTSDDSQEEKEIQRILTETNFKEIMLRRAPLHLGIWGNCFLEYIWNINKTEIEEITTVDPKTMDFLREDVTSGRILFEEDGTPQGWVQQTYIAEADKEHRKGAGEPKKFNKNSMEHLTLFCIHDGEMATGLIEPIYKDAEIKENIEHAMGELIYTAGFPKPVVKYGTVEKGTSKEMKGVADSAGREYVDPTSKGVSLPYFVDLTFPKLSSEYQNLHRSLYYLSSLQATVMGIPTALLLMSGEMEKRGSLDQLIQFFEYNLNHMQRSLKIPRIMRKILISRGIKKPVFRFEWNKLMLKSQKEKIMRLRRLAQSGLLQKGDKDIEDWVRRVENLPTGSLIKKQGKG